MLLPDRPRELLDPQDGLPSPWAVVLGTAQDGGHPHVGCEAPCCEEAWGRPDRGHLVAGLGLVDPRTRQAWLIEATPDLPRQLHALSRWSGCSLAGVLLTHAHIGHYTGLVHLGKEALGARELPVYAMPRMRRFLGAHAPWSVLVTTGAVRLSPLEDGEAVALSPELTVTPFRVPHRDELSETVGFRVSGPRRRVAWLPDINAWEDWEVPLERLLAEVDAAWIDGTFFSAGEVAGARDAAAIPHPPMVQTMRRLQALPADLRARVRFVHLNHTNPALDPTSEASRAVEAQGFGIAREGERVWL